MGWHWLGIRWCLPSIKWFLLGIRWYLYCEVSSDTFKYHLISRCWYLLIPPDTCWYQSDTYQILGAEHRGKEWLGDEEDVGDDVKLARAKFLDAGAAVTLGVHLLDVASLPSLWRNLLPEELHYHLPKKEIRHLRSSFAPNSWIIAARLLDMAPLPSPRRNHLPPPRERKQHCVHKETCCWRCGRKATLCHWREGVVGRWEGHWRSSTSWRSGTTSTGRLIVFVRSGSASVPSRLTMGLGKPVRRMGNVIPSLTFL